MTDEIDVIRHMDRARQLRSEAMHEMAGELRTGLVRHVRRMLHATAGKLARPAPGGRNNVDAGR